MKSSWYFDLISPFSYLHLKQFHRLPSGLEIEYVPVLFAGLLKHWGHKGPAEIPAKRVYMCRQLNWLSGRLGIPFKMPPAHPFNPLSALRLVIAAGPNHENVEAAFDMVWKDGLDMQEPDNITELGRRLKIHDVAATLVDDNVKTILRKNTEAAIAQGVFGVPTFRVGDVLFWGQDSLDMMLDYIKDPGLFDTREMRRAHDLPVGSARKEISKS